MSNRTLNRLLISTICFLCLIICALILLIINRPQHITTQGSAGASIENLPETEIIHFENKVQENASTVEETTAPPATEEANQTVYARTTCLLNIRASNNTDAAVVETVNENTILQVLEIQQDGWTKILYEGQEAYVSSAYIILIH